MAFSAFWEQEDVLRCALLFYFIAAGTIALSQYFLNYCGCYSNLRPLQGVAAGDIWYGRDSMQLSLLLCTELKVILSTFSLPSGPTASVAVLCPSQLASESSSLCLFLRHFEFTVPIFAVTAIPRPFGAKCFLSHELVFFEEWPPALSQ